MKVYLPIGSNRCQLCQPVNDSEFEVFSNFAIGTFPPTAWKPLTMEMIYDDEGKSLKPSDAPWLGMHPLIFRENAVFRMREWIEPYGELLPLNCSEGGLFVFIVTTMVDALNEAASDISRFPDGRVMRVKKYVFDPKAIDGNDVFRIPNPKSSRTFVSDRFVKAWKTAGLTGLDFEEVWSSRDT